MTRFRISDKGMDPCDGDMSVRYGDEIELESIEEKTDAPEPVLRCKLKQAISVIEFYAHEDNWAQCYVSGVEPTEPETIKDCGEKARAFLKELEK